MMKHYTYKDIQMCVCLYVGGGGGGEIPSMLQSASGVAGDCPVGQWLETSSGVFACHSEESGTGLRQNTNKESMRQTQTKNQ